jgi:hypothetical protein
MAQYSLNTSMIQRSAGSSAVAHVAYITAAKIVDLRTGQEADYTRREGVLYLAPEIVLPAGERETQSAKIGRGQLWNMAEAAEKRKDGNPARKVLVALPHELEPEQRLAMTQRYAQWMADRYGVAVDFAIHKPDRQGDQRNFHAHIVLTTRQIRDGQLAEKSQLEWKGAKLKEAGLPSGIAMVHELRESWESIQNEHLSRHAPEVEPVSCQRLKVQREVQIQRAIGLEQLGKEPEAREAQLNAIELDRTPQQHVGWAATAMERRPEPIPTERGDQRRQAQREHQELRDLVAAIRKRIARSLAWVESLAKKSRKKQPEQQPVLFAPVELVSVEPVSAPKIGTVQEAIDWLDQHDYKYLLQEPLAMVQRICTHETNYAPTDAERAGWKQTSEVIVPYLRAQQVERLKDPVQQEAQAILVELKPDPVQEAQKTPMPVVETPSPVQATPAEPSTTAVDLAEPTHEEKAQADAAMEDQLQAAITWLREHHSEAVLQYPLNGAHHFIKESIEMSRDDAEKAGWERTRDVIVPHLLRKQAARKAALEKDRELHPEKYLQRGRGGPER